MATQHGTELSPLSRSFAPREETRWQPGAQVSAEEAQRLMAERREQERMNKMRRFWYAEFDREEWWREFNRGWSYVGLIMMGVFAFGLIIGYVAHGAIRHG